MLKALLIELGHWNTVSYMMNSWKDGTVTLIFYGKWRDTKCIILY